MFLVDTDIMVDVIRNFEPAINWIGKVKEEDLFLPGFVVMELIQGCNNRVQQKIVEKTIKNQNILWPHNFTYDRALSVFKQFRLSHNIGILDVLIGQMAVDADMPLLTFNLKHYELIPDIEIIQPYCK